MLVRVANRLVADGPSLEGTEVIGGVAEIEVELFDGGWLDVLEGVPPIRAIVAWHRAPAPGQ